MPAWTERIILWKTYGFAPWQWDGYPADCDDPSVTVLWAKRAADYEIARADADTWLETLTDDERKMRRDKREDALLSKYMTATTTGQGANEGDTDDDW